MNIDHYTEIKKRTAAYWYVDGLSEIGMGILLLVLGISFLFTGFVQPETPSTFLWGFGQPLVVLSIALGVGRLIKIVKAKLTYPRTGYVSYPRPKGRRRVLNILLSMLVAGLLAFLLNTLGDFVTGNMMIAFSAIIFAGLGFYLGLQFGLTRFYVVGGLVAAWGFFLAWLNPVEPLSTVFLFSGIGILWILSGLVTLIRYLRSTSPMDEETIE